MKYENLSEEQKAIWDEGYQKGFDDALETHSSDETWDEGFNEGYEAGEEEGYNTGIQDGIEQEQNRVQYVLNMMFESALNMGQGNKAVQYKHAMDLVAPIKLKPIEYDDDF